MIKSDISSSEQGKILNLQIMSDILSFLLSLNISISGWDFVCW
jgi:hypothetical protein